VPGQYPDAEIESLIAWREEVLEPAPDVESIGGASNGFQCRPGELLVDASFEGRMPDLVDHADLPAPTPIETSIATILHYSSPHIEVGRVLGRARTDPDRDQLMRGVRPNLVFCGEQAYQGFPGGWPKPERPEFPNLLGESEGPIVAVLDTGYTSGVHEADGLDSRFGDWGPPTTPEKLDVTNPSGWRDFEAGHATFICGIIAHRVQRARLRVVPTLDSRGYVDEAGLAWKIKELAPDVDIVNLSLGCFSPDNLPPIALKAAIADLPSETAVVAAAGNAGPKERPFWPAQLDKDKSCEEKVVFAVGALGEDGETAAYSTDPADLYATGRSTSAFIEFDETKSQIARVKGRSPHVFEGYATWAGTSFATAVIAAKIAEEMDDGRSALAVARELCSNGAKVL
jgi:hypothetical protein